MNIIRWFFRIVAILFSLFMCISSPFAFIGVLLVVFGVYQGIQKRKGKVTFSKPGWFIAIGLVLSFVLGVSMFEEPVETSKSNDTKVADEVTTRTKEEEKKKKEEAELDAKKAEEEKEKQEEAKKAEEEKKKKTELASQLGLEAVIVARAVDGDTLELDDGRKIRLVGVNTPESTTKTEEYGKEASNYTSEQLKGKQVWIQKDVSDTDQYDRYLRVIWLDIPTDDTTEEEIRSKMFNAQLVLNGYAEPSTYPPDVKYSEYFVKFAEEARESETGLWAYGEDGTTKGDLDPTEVSSSNSSSDNSSQTTDSTESDEAEQESSSEPEYFQNCTELRKVYPSGVSSDHPAYDSKHDRDKDNFACEK